MEGIIDYKTNSSPSAQASDSAFRFFTTTRLIGRDKHSLCSALGVPAECFFRPHQVHGIDVLTLDERKESFTLPGGGHEWAYDAVIYNVRNACIGISTADCIPVLCYDPVHHCAAAIHAGWRSTVARIVVNAIEQMRSVFGTDPTLLRCVIGPGISLESFEVGDEVYEAFSNAGFDMNLMAKRYPINDSQIANNKLSNCKYKWHLDIKECNRMQLLAMGVKPENIEVSPLDTMTDERFFSARREGAQTGRMLSGILLK